ncbi:pyridoxamine 5'-phosphate oxidase family protein [Flavobacteriaceae bacterium]|nr:pyridoxamine 5'-phosphate oxidase family protein [Flavobacteriaceae bacterium]
MHTGTKGELEIQNQQNSSKRADVFYKRQMKSILNNKMKALIERQEMVFIATSDADGNCDCSPRFGEKGLVSILDNTTLAYPDYRGNGVFASLGNIQENPHIGMVFVDFYNTTVGLHVNGKAHSFPMNQLPEKHLDTIIQLSSNIEVEIERWVIVQIDEAYIHCSKHVPKLKKVEKKIKWGTDDEKEKSTNYFSKQETEACTV